MLASPASPAAWVASGVAGYQPGDRNGASSMIECVVVSISPARINTFGSRLLLPDGVDRTTSRNRRHGDRLVLCLMKPRLRCRWVGAG